MLKQPLVSIIINCFNGEKYLHEALDSVITQTYNNWEIIFWDNQSIDKSAEIFKSYKDSRLKYYCAPSHTSILYEARNYALEKVKKISKGGYPQYGIFKQRKFEIQKLYPNVEKAKNKINWRPKISFEKGLKKTINSYK